MTELLCIQASDTFSLKNWVAISSIISGTAAAIGIIITIVLYRKQLKTSQKQIILPLWEYISKLREINSATPITPDVIDAINTLELIATLCTNGIIDEDIIIKSFKSQYIKHYDNIKNCGALPGLNNKTGLDLINENKNVKEFYKKLKK